MKSLWIGFSLIIFIYTSYTNRSYNENSTYPFFYTLFSLIFLTSYYGQNYISWDSSSLSIVLFTNDKIKINKYINGKYLTMALLTSISFIVLLIINIIRLSLNIELIKLTILYIYSTICLPPLYLYFGLSNNFKINLREKSILSHWDDKSSIPQLSFLIFIAFTCLTYFIFDLTNTADYAYVFFLILSLVTLSIKHSLVKFLVLKILKKKQILFEKLISI
ncbi:hypothetical protein [Lacibacter sp. MH-610]|uniref:hypothetical protein n=1 Tax=Lacibacter sp. MH-610 TaxID=3020883 RepID=UPI003891497C